MDKIQLPLFGPQSGTNMWLFPLHVKLRVCVKKTLGPLRRHLNKVEETKSDDHVKIWLHDKIKLYLCTEGSSKAKSTDPKLNRAKARSTDIK